MPDCPLADECPSFTERIEGMGCVHYGDRGGAEWCKHYSQPISDLKQQPVQVGEEVVVDVEDIHESGAGVGRTDDGFIVMVDGVLPEARARVEITKVQSNFAWGEELERLPLEPDDDGDEEDDDVAAADEGEDEQEESSRPKREERLGSRENFWGG
ncbi:deoxyribonuclease [Halobacteriales archaeon QS_1_68_20]|nr:MAG: deoxyribonuclease [Halobacteriales archaeon QS_1_68_20]